MWQYTMETPFGEPATGAPVENRRVTPPAFIGAQQLEFLALPCVMTCRFSIRLVLRF